MIMDEAQNKEDYATLVLKQVDTIIEKYTPERGEKFFTNDIQAYLITVGSAMIVEDISEYYHFPNKELANKLYKAFFQESRWYPKHCDTYCKASIIQDRLAKFRARIKKIVAPPKLTQAQINAEFQKNVLERLENIENKINHIISLLPNYASQS